MILVTCVSLKLKLISCACGVAAFRCFYLTIFLGFEICIAPETKNIHIIDTIDISTTTARVDRVIKASGMHFVSNFNLG